MDLEDGMNVLESLKAIGGVLLLGDPKAEVTEVAYDSRDRKSVV